MTIHIPKLQRQHNGKEVVTVVVNGQEHQITAQSDLQQIICQLGLPELGCVFAINNTVVPRSEWSRTCLSEGDSISLFQAIAGG
ncbi:sulfur carrier protein ThiS [Vibrio sp. SM6]|uniref:Sulfur carrier protein ThiS n=1 Tax=Vibrio agarilyticus TaxID=2726741 RepID=A0A7X8YIU8_9VIBR|nr:sulfur carrier protein ThiS [Vibrio agarilyticus]NLS14797.1 sulfur carrier protein ThiS [Vibrio agarilyticus]